MLKIFNYNASDFSKNGLAVLDKARDAAVTLNLSQKHTITFDYPRDEKSKYININNIVVCEGQAYRISSVTRDTNSGLSVLHVEGERLFFSDAVRKHIPNVPDMPGVDPYRVLKKGYEGITTTDDKSYEDFPGAIYGTSFNLLTEEEIVTLGMKRIGADGAKIDFFNIDKTNPLSVCEAIIEALGKGEIYVDNYNIAIVERIGRNNGVRLMLGKNLQNLSVQRQTTELCTRLYPYGENDLTIATVNDDKVYIDSPDAQELFGIVEGYKDYSEYDSPAKLKQHAEWDLKGEGNYYRLDSPQITITGDVIDLAKLSGYGAAERFSLGDTVHVFDEDNTEIEGEQRIINITHFPYSSKPPRVTIGAPSGTNLFYSQWQTGRLMKTLKKNSTTATSKIRAQAVSGSSAKVKKITAASTKTDLLTASSASISTLSIGKTDVAAKLADLQQQIDELKGDEENA